jgi:hypothetical protein
VYETKLPLELTVTPYMAVIEASPEVDNRPSCHCRVDLFVTFREKNTAFIPFSALYKPAYTAGQGQSVC